MPERGETVQGMEMLMGVNVVAHYALVCRIASALANSLTPGAAPRIVWLSSDAHKLVFGIDFDDFDKKLRYSKWFVYGESKLANLYLMQKFAEIYPQFIVTGCHPGLSKTNLSNGMTGQSFINNFLQSSLMGSLPTVMAAIDPSLKSNDYIGPFWDGWGLPAHAWMFPHARNKESVDRLFQICEEKTGLTPPKF
jgi:NAD(P)-dependent dehydrogenase (short-subunit alcohol dehydrogenase family)